MTNIFYFMSIFDPFISKDAAKLGDTPGEATKRIKGISGNERNVSGTSEEGGQGSADEKRGDLGAT